MNFEEKWKKPKSSEKEKNLQKLTNQITVFEKNFLAFSELLSIFPAIS